MYIHVYVDLLRKCIELHVHTVCIYMYMWIYCVRVFNYTQCVLYMYTHAHEVQHVTYTVLLIECLFLSMCSSVEEDVPLVSKTAAVVQSKWELVDYGQRSSSEEEVEEKKKKKEEERLVASLLIM